MNLSPTRLLAVLAFALAFAGAFAAEPPPAEGQAARTDQAMVRFLHAAPNAQIDNVFLRTGDGDVVVEEFGGLSYGEVSEYVPMTGGNYEVGVRLSATGDGADVIADVPVSTLDTMIGEYYTVALIGLVSPDQTQTEDQGFFDWLSNLFTSDDDAYTLRTVVMTDTINWAVAQDESEVRIAHFAPGVDTIDLVAPNQDGGFDVVHTVGYGEVSGFSRAAATAGPLQLRAAGSEAVLFDLGELGMDAGRGHTVVVSGTPLEQVPVELLHLESPDVAPAGLGGVTVPPGALAPGAVAFDAEQVTFLHGSLSEIEARLTAIEQRLANLASLEGAQDDVNAAQQEIDAARALLLDAQAQIEGQPVAPPAQPAGGN